MSARERRVSHCTRCGRCPAPAQEAVGELYGAPGFVRIVSGIAMPIWVGSAGEFNFIKGFAPARKAGMTEVDLRINRAGMASSVIPAFFAAQTPKGFEDISNNERGSKK